MIHEPVFLERDVLGDKVVWFIEAPFEMNRDHPEIIGQQVRLMGHVYVVKKVWRHLSASPIMPGETIGLIVE